MSKVCLVCKGPIKDDEMSHAVTGGHVHGGVCKQAFEETPLAESSDVLTETSLLL